MIPTGQEEEGEDQEIIHTSQLTTDSDDPADQGSNPIQGNAAPWIAKRVADWLDSLGSQTVTLKCDNEPATLALAQEIRRQRREGGITISEHPEKEERQSNHLAEGSVNFVKGFLRTLKEDRDWPVSSAGTMDN